MTCSNDFKKKPLTNRHDVEEQQKKLKSSLNPNFDAITTQNHQNHQNHKKSLTKTMKNHEKPLNILAQGAQGAHGPRGTKK